MLVAISGAYKRFNAANSVLFIQLSLFFDILLCMAEDVNESAFVDGERSGSYGRSTRMGTKRSSQKEMMLMKGARASLWKILRGVSLKGGTVCVESVHLLTDWEGPEGKIFGSRSWLTSAARSVCHGREPNISLSGPT